MDGIGNFEGGGRDAWVWISKEKWGFLGLGKILRICLQGNI